jgi:hypothetical protein
VGRPHTILVELKITSHRASSRMSTTHPDRDYSPPKSQNSLGSCGIEVVGFDEFGVHGCGAGCAPDGPPPAHRRLCRNSGGAAPPGLGSQRHRTSRRISRGGHIPSSPENTVVAVPPHSECGHPQPASFSSAFSSAPHSHTVHPKPTAAPCTRVETTRHNTAMINRHRDGYPSRQQWARPTEKPPVLTPSSWRQPVRRRVIPTSDLQSWRQRGEQHLSGPSVGIERRRTAPPSASVVFRPSTSMSASSFASVPALVMQPPCDDRVGHVVGPRFGGSARSPRYVHAVS